MPSTSIPLRNRRLPTATSAEKANARRPPPRIIPPPPTAPGQMPRVSSGRVADIAHATRTAAANRGVTTPGGTLGLPPPPFTLRPPGLAPIALGTASVTSSPQATVFLSVGSNAKIAAGTSTILSHSLDASFFPEQIAIRNPGRWTVHSLRIGNLELVGDPTLGVPADLINRTLLRVPRSPTGTSLVIEAKLLDGADDELIVDLSGLGTPSQHTSSTTSTTPISSVKSSPGTAAAPIAAAPIAAK
jgi:hypothetical protein